MSDLLKTSLESIAICDDCLCGLRANWMAAEPSKKAAHWERINQMLDTRLRLMAKRDAAMLGSVVDPIDGVDVTDAGGGNGG